VFNVYTARPQVPEEDTLLSHGVVVFHWNNDDFIDFFSRSPDLGLQATIRTRKAAGNACLTNLKVLDCLFNGGTSTSHLHHVLRSNVSKLISVLRYTSLVV